jgi:CRISPR-associated protein Cmr3
MKQHQWTFAALDTLFFKESRPMEAVGGSQLASIFPPPSRTLIGAIRTAIGESQKVNWMHYAKGDSPLCSMIGTADSLGPLRFTGPYLIRQGERLFPMPLTYLQSEQGQTRLLPSEEAVHCDLGKVCLPVKQDTTLAGSKPLENAFLSGNGLSAFLNGADIDKADIFLASQLYSREDRLGIGRDYQTHSVEDGLLYQTCHIRPKHDAQLQIGIALDGLTAELPTTGMTRLGAEGRLAAWQREEQVGLPGVPVMANAKGLMLMLLTPALFTEGWLLQGFQEQIETEATGAKQAGRKVWEGEIAGVKLRLISSVVGKPVREGGWDMANKKPRALASYAPAGSCYFCEIIDGDIAKAQAALHGLQIGQEQEYGRGQLAAGYW